MQSVNIVTVRVCGQYCPSGVRLTHLGRVTHICVSKLTIIDSDNGLSPDRRQAIIWINTGILLIGPLGTNFSEILIETFSFKKMRLKMSSAKQRPSCLGLNVLRFGVIHNTWWAPQMSFRGISFSLIQTAHPSLWASLCKIIWRHLILITNCVADLPF